MQTQPRKISAIRHIKILLMMYTRKTEDLGYFALEYHHSRKGLTTSAEELLDV